MFIPIATITICAIMKNWLCQGLESGISVTSLEDKDH